jgi:hypothetical protein
MACNNTCHRKGKYAISVNERNSLLDKYGIIKGLIIEMFNVIKGHKPISWLVRETLENATDYNENSDIQTNDKDNKQYNINDKVINNKDVNDEKELYDDNEKNIYNLQGIIKEKNYEYENKQDNIDKNPKKRLVIGSKLIKASYT